MSSKALLIDNNAVTGTVFLPRPKNRGRLQIQLKEFIGIAFIVIAALFIPGATTTIFGCLILWSLFSVNGAIYALILMGFIRNGNYACLMTPNTLMGALGWLLLITASARVILTVPRKAWLQPILILLYLFGAAVFVISFKVSPLVEISVSKLISFLMGVTTLILGFWYLQSDRKFLNSGGTDGLLYFVFISFIVLSVPALFFEDFGYVANGRSFQGLTDQPQLLGILLAPLISWALGVRFEQIGQKKSGGSFSKNLTPVICVALFLLFATNSRTAALCVFLPIICCTIAAFTVKKEWRSHLKTSKTRNPWTPLIVFCLGILIILASGRITSFAESFLLKSEADKGGSLSDSYDSARGELILASWIDFLRSPLFGTGFGIPFDTEEYEILRDPIFGIAISAPGEKGNAYTALLGETGLVGSVVFLIVLGVMTRQVLRSGSLSSAMLFFSALFVNNGEAVLFSFGGPGLIIWFYISVSLFNTKRPTVEPSRKG